MKSRWKIGLVAAALLVNAPQASADLKSVFTAVCDAHTDALVTTAGPTTQPGKPTPAVCSPDRIVFPNNECRTLMLCMDQAGWHVIHDTRYGGAWAESVIQGFPAAEAFYKLIFQKD